MNGWTPSVSLETRVSNLFAQIPQEHHALAAKTCYGTDDYDFERKLTSYVICKGWEHPADVAFDLESVTEAEQVAAEVERDDKWLDSDISRNWDCTPIPSDMPQIDFDGIGEIAL